MARTDDQGDEPRATCSVGALAANTVFEKCGVVAEVVRKVSCNRTYAIKPQALIEVTKMVILDKQCEFDIRELVPLQ